MVAFRPVSTAVPASALSHFRTPLRGCLVRTCHRTLSADALTPPTQHSAVNDDLRLLLNGPESTHPAPLKLPPADDRGAVQRWIGIGKAYYGFYKDGIKNLLANRRHAQDVSTKIQGWSMHDAVRDGLLTRSEVLLLKRSSFDTRRLPVFGLILAIFGEFTPLIVLAFPSVVPWTCRLQNQIVGGWKKLEHRRRQFEGMKPAPPAPGQPLESLSRPQLLYLSNGLGLHSSLWPISFGLPPTGVLTRRLQARLGDIEMDDRLLKSEDAVEYLTLDEVRLALVQRGQDVIGRSDSELRSSLRSWLKSREEAKAFALLLPKRETE